jgi:hypothetical protein
MLEYFYKQTLLLESDLVKWRNLSVSPKSFLSKIFDLRLSSSERSSLFLPRAYKVKTFLQD